MKKLFLFSIVLFFASLSLTAQTRVRGYYKSDGTYVRSHVRSTRNYTNHDNWSTVGNVNPYTGTRGSVARDYSTNAYNYGGGNTIYVGPQGGQYYINSNNNKVYVPKTTRSSYRRTSSFGTSQRTLPSFPSYRY